nr:phage tail protein [Roseococcus pinisoli]
MIYPDTAYALGSFDSELFGSSIPSRGYEIDGRLIKVPTNYDPTARTYSGVWDGSFKEAWTNNPAWILYDLLTDRRVGLGRHIPESYVDKWGLYNIAVYCDGTVPDGFGGYEPRYTFNGILNTREDAFKVLQSVASSFRGMLYWGAGAIQVVADMPADPVKLVTNANVLAGNFTYEGTALKSRHTYALVTWNNPDLGYGPDIEPVEAGEYIDKIGVRQTEVMAYGCTSRGQAHRMGKWALFTENESTETCSWKASLDQFDLRPGDIVYVADENLAGIRQGGRVVSATTVSMVVDAPVTLGAAGGTIRVMLPNGTLESRVVNNPAGIHTTLTWGTALSQTPLPDAMWVVSDATIAPRQFRVVTVLEVEPNVIEIISLYHDPGKYSWVELGIRLDQPPSTIYLPRGGMLSAPTDLQVDEYVTGTGVTSLVRVIFSWRPPLNDNRLRGFEVQAISEGIVLAQGSTVGSSFTFETLSPAVYSFQVRSVGDEGQVSGWVSTSQINVDGLTDPPQTPTAISITGGIRQNTLNWAHPAGRFIRAVEVQASGLGFDNAGDGPYDNLPSAPLDGTFTKIGETAGTNFTHAGLAASHVWYYRVRSVDVFGQFSPWVGPFGVRTSYLVAADIRDGILDTAKFAAGIMPVELLENLDEDRPENTVAFNKEDGRLYRRVNGTWTAEVPAADISGQLTDEQIADLDATKLIGQVTSEQIEKLDADKISGQLTSEQIADLDAAKIAGELSAEQIADRAIVASKIAEAAVGTYALALGSVTASKLYIGPGSINPDRFFIDPAYWAADPDGWSIQEAAGSNEAALLGVSRAAVLSDAAFTGDARHEINTPVSSPVSQAIAGEALRLRARGRNSNPEQLVTVGLQFFDVAGGYISGAVLSWSDEDSDPRGVMKDVQVTGPMNANSFRLVVYNTGGSAWAGVAVVSDVQVVLATDGSMVVDGAITARQLATYAISTDKLAAGSIITEKLAAGAVTASKVAAGAITTEALAVGSGNQIWNSTCDVAATGWGSWAGGTYTGTATLGPAAPPWRLDGYGSGMLFAPGIVPIGGVLSAYFLANSGYGFTVTPGRTYQAAALLQNHRCRGHLEIQWRDSSGAWIGATSSDEVPTNQAADGRFDDRYARAMVLGVAPLLAAYGMLAITGHGTGASDAYVYFTKTLFSEAPSNAVEVGPWTAGGMTSIEGGMVRARTIQADRIVAASITADELAANSIVAGKISAEAVTANKIAAGAVTANKIAAGAITAEKLAVGSGNLVWNSTCDVATSGWNVWSGGAYAGAATLSPAAYPWRLLGYGSGQLFAPGYVPVGGAFSAIFSTDATFGFTVIEGRTYQAAALLQNHRCRSRIDIEWRDGNGTWLGAASSQEVPTNQTTEALYDFRYARATVLGVAPPGAVFGRLAIAGIGTGETDAYVFFTKTMLSEAPKNAVEVGLWVAGGVTTIEGGMVRARSIQADRIVAASISATELAADSVVAGKIAAGAISARELAAYQIRAYHLASEMIIAQTIQVANLIIGTEKIGPGSMSTAYGVANSPGDVLLNFPGYGNVATRPIADLFLQVNAGEQGRVLLVFDDNMYSAGSITLVTYSEEGGGGDGGGGGGE